MLSVFGFDGLQHACETRAYKTIIFSEDAHDPDQILMPLEQWMRKWW